MPPPERQIHWQPLGACLSCRDESGVPVGGLALTGGGIKMTPGYILPLFHLDNSII